jgi:lipid II:glycine glycyltransferase (peptidoglycan interpeptide bridge formation enzyme)
MVTWRCFSGNCEEWNNFLIELDNYTIYQSYNWGEIKKENGWHVYRAIAYENNKIISMMQVLYKRFPLKTILAWIPGGIVGSLDDIDLIFIKKELNANFIIARCSFNFESKTTEKLLNQVGWTKAKVKMNTGLSMSLNPQEDLDLIKSKCSKNWRHNLNRSFKKDNIITTWTNVKAEELFSIYSQFENDKGISQQYSLNNLSSILNHLNNNLILLKAFNSNGELLGLRAFAHLKDKAWDLMAITTQEGRKSYSSHRLFWNILEEAKKIGITSYDFSGIDPEGNKGVYNFKKGTGAAHVEYLGEWDYSSFFPLKLVFNFYLYKKGISI